MTARHRLPRGVHRDIKGWRIFVQSKGHVFRKRFPPSMKQDAVEAELLKARQRWGAGRRGTFSGTLQDDVLRYLADYYTGRGGLAERRRHLALWVSALGADTPRVTITRDDVARVLNRWRAAGLAADTCNKRRTALLALYSALDGKGAPNPVREVPKFKAPDPLPRGLPYVQIEKALAQLPACKTKARLQVMAYTGIRAGQLMRLEHAHWDTRRKLLTVPGTEKGKGTKPYVLPLSEAATQALKAFDKLDAWGTFTWAPMARMWKGAAAAAKLPTGTKPYDLRHSFGTQVYRKTGDLKATKELLGHASLRMTERYMLAAVAPQKTAAIKRAFR